MRHIALPTVCRFVLATCLLSSACGGDDKPKHDDTPADVCTPGTSFQCISGTCNGFQQCLSDGSGYSACICDDSGQSGTGANDMDAAISGKDAASGNTSDAAVPGSDASVPHCGATSQCVPEAPTGFEGPVALYAGSAKPPACADAWGTKAVSAGADPAADPASCSTCTCTPSGSGCPSFLDFGTTSMSGCAGTACTTSVSASCIEIAPPCIAGVGTASLETKLSGTASTCEPSAQTPTKPAAAFDTQVVACAASDLARVDCKQGELCAPPVGSPFQPELCIWRAGDHACPAGDYSDHRTYFRKLDDTRACSACACDGPDCTLSWKVFAAADTTCATPIVSLSDVGQCVQVNPTSDALRVGVTISGTGACAPSGGAATGAVAGGDPITVCCLP